MRAPIALLLACAAVAVGCRGAPRGQTDGSRAGATAADSLCGTLRVLGSEPAVVVQLETAAGAPTSLWGDERAKLRLLTGLGVCVFGSGPSSDGWKVDRFVVREHEGRPVVDGMLVARDSAFAVRTAEGQEVRLFAVPDALRSAAGARVWVVLDESGRVQVSGVIR